VLVIPDLTLRFPVRTAKGAAGSDGLSESISPRYSHGHRLRFHRNELKFSGPLTILLETLPRA
jgi:hypothetical protein